MPIFPESLAVPFRRSHTSSTLPTAPKPGPRPPHRRCSCRFHFPSPFPFRVPFQRTSRRHRQPLPDSYPEAPQPHYFDSYTGTWSPRKLPLTPAAGRSGIWSPRAIVSRIGTPARRPATPAAPSSAAADGDGDATATATTTTTPLPGEAGDEKPTSAMKTWSPLRRRGPRTPPHPPPLPPAAAAAAARPPSRGKQYPRQHLHEQQQQKQKQQQQEQQQKQQDEEEKERQQHYLNQNHFTEYPFGEKPLDPADASWVVTQVPLPARSDTCPMSRDFADGGGGWMVTDVIEEVEEEEEEEGEGEGKEERKEEQVEEEEEERGAAEEAMIGAEMGEVEPEREGERVKVKKALMPSAMHHMNRLPVLERAMVV